MNLYYTLDENKNPVPVDMFTWAKTYTKYIHVGDNTFEIGDEKIRVSTVFLGLNHAYGNEPPVLFETMIFGGEYDQYQEQYHTWAEAESGHKEAIEMIFQ